MCRVLQVSRQGYYKWRNSRDIETPTEARSRELLENIVRVFEESGERYGAPRVHAQLKREGIHCNKKTVASLMRKHGIQARRKRSYKRTTDSNHDLPIAPNLLERDFTASTADEVWVSDITYVPTNEGWLFLCVFVDLYSRLIVGWSMSDTMPSQLVLDAFAMGTARRGDKAPIVVHSDRGSQYASQDFRDELARYDCIQSMSRKGDCFDNAVAESFFGALKSELIYHHTFKTRKEAEMVIFEYVEIFFNRKRLHSTLGYLTPEEKEQKDRQVA